MGKGTEWSGTAKGYLYAITSPPFAYSLKFINGRDITPSVADDIIAYFNNSSHIPYKYLRIGWAVVLDDKIEDKNTSKIDRTLIFQTLLKA